MNSATRLDKDKKVIYPRVDQFGSGGSLGKNRHESKLYLEGFRDRIQWQMKLPTPPAHNRSIVDVEPGPGSSRWHSLTAPNLLRDNYASRAIMNVVRLEDNGCQKLGLIIAGSTLEQGEMLQWSPHDASNMKVFYTSKIGKSNT